MFAIRRFVAVSSVLVFAAVLFVAAPAVAAQDQSPEMQAVVRAEQLVQQGNPDAALEELQKLLAANPEFAAAYFVQALAYNAKGQKAEAYDALLKATQYNPGWGQAHRLASMYAADMGNLDASWEQAIKAHQSGTDMSDAFAGLQTMGAPPADFEARTSVARMFIGPIDTEIFEESGDTALQGGANSSASSRTDRGKRIVQEAAPDLYQLQQEARRQVAGSRTFGLVQRQDQAQLIMVFEIDDIADSTRRRTRGYIKLVNAQSGEEVHKRRVEFADIASRGDLNRDFSRIMGQLEEWAAQQRR